MNVFMDADPVWEEKYSRGHTQRYPWDCIVSFVYRNAPRGRPRGEVAVLELGCGTGGNLWFLAREGFRASGIDASPSAVAAARTRLSADGLDAALHVGSFCELPFPDASFDLVLDRCSVTCVGAAGARQAVLETRRVLRPGGLFFFNPYSAAHDSRRTGRPGSDGLTLDISAGSLVGVGGLRFYDHADIIDLFSGVLDIVTCRHMVEADEPPTPHGVHAEWRVTARRPEAG